MGSTIPQLALFPLYPGGPMVRNTGGINGYSSFTLPKTEFTPAYGVNMPRSNSVNNDNTYLTLDRNQRLQRQKLSNVDVFTRNIGFDGSVLGGIKQTPVPAVAPTIPSLYQELVKLMSVTDANMAELLKLPEFRIGGIGLGLKVTTDGLGNIDNVAISPSSRGVMPGVPVDQLGGPNRAEITTGATFKADPGVGLGGSPAATNAAQSPNRLNNTPGTAQPLPQTSLLNLNKLDRNAGIFNLDRLNALDKGLQGPQSLNLDQVLDRLYQLETPERGLAVSGYDAVLNAEQARYLAANQARLEVSSTNRFKDNLTSIVSGASRQGSESYAASFNPRMMDGRMPMVPSLPNTHTGAGTGGFGESSGFNLGASVADSMNRKSSGGYIPFSTQSDAQGQMMSGGSGAGGGNPFMMAGGSSGQGQQQRRRPLAFTA